MRRFLLILGILVILIAAGLTVLVLSFNDERVRQLVVAQVESHTGRTLEIAGELNWRLFPWLSIEAHEVSLSNPDGFEEPHLFEASLLRFSLRLLPLLRGRIETGEITLEQAVIRILTNPAGRSNLQGLTAPAEPGSTRHEVPRITTGPIRLTGIALVVEDEARDAREVYLIEHFLINPFAFDTPTEFSFRGRLGEDGALERISAEGRVVVPRLGSGPLHVLGLRAAARLAPDGPEVEMQGDLTMNPAPLVIELEQGALLLDGQPLTASLHYTAQPRPRLRAELAGEHLDLDRLIAGLPEGEGDVAGSDGHALAFLRLMDLDARLRLDRLTAAGLTLEQVQARARSEGGVLRIEPLEGMVAGGRISAVAEVDVRPAAPKIRVSPTLAFDDFGEILAPWGLNGLISGSGRLGMSLQGESLVPTEFLAGLKGQGELNLADGRLHGFDLSALMADFDRDNPLAAVGRAMGGETRFNTLSTPLTVADGTLRLPSLDISAADFGLRGQLNVNLADTALSGRLSIQGAREIPLLLSGSVASPQLAVDVENVARGEVQRRLIDALERRRGREEARGDEEADAPRQPH